MYYTLKHLHDGEIFKLFWKYGLASSNIPDKAFSMLLALVVIGSIVFMFDQIQRAHRNKEFEFGSLAMQVFWLITSGFLIVFSFPQQVVQIIQLL